MRHIARKKHEFHANTHVGNFLEVDNNIKYTFLLHSIQAQNKRQTIEHKHAHNIMKCL